MLMCTLHLGQFWFFDNGLCQGFISLMKDEEVTKKRQTQPHVILSYPLL